MNVISISGGRSSAMMLRILQENGTLDANTKVVFANTGRESDETLEFIQECSARWQTQRPRPRATVPGVVAGPELFTKPDTANMYC